MSDETPELLEFPCRFSIKAMGLNQADFEDLVVEIVSRHAELADDAAVSSRDSRGGKYLAVTVAVTARSREQLDKIYMDLSAHDKVVMAL